MKRKSKMLAASARFRSIGNRTGACLDLIEIDRERGLRVFTHHFAVQMIPSERMMGWRVIAA